jgi:hypothetical protein
MIRLSRFSLVLILLVSTSTIASAQVTTGTPPLGTFGGGPDVIDLGNLNAHIAVPVLHKTGRGINFTYDLSYDTSVWYPVSSGGPMSWKSIYNWGWRAQTEVATGYISYGYSGNGQCADKNGNRTTGRVVVQAWIYHDPFGVPHPFSGTLQADTGSCYPHVNGTITAAIATDGSGYTLNANLNANTGILQATITSTSGQVSTPPQVIGTGSGGTVDSNGNELTVDGSGHFYDTLPAPLQSSPLLAPELQLARLR